MKRVLSSNLKMMKRGRSLYSLLFSTLLLIIFLMMPAVLQARIKLITLPLREKVEIQLDHQNVTLVEEERVIPLIETPENGEPNQVDFSWANTAINPDTIVFRLIGKQKGGNAGLEANVLSVSYPPNEQALVCRLQQIKAAQSCHKLYPASKLQLSCPRIQR